jgi:pyruvate formate lyase activating enzyme
VPGFNDGDDELSRIARFISELSRDIPWHVTAFHPDYRMTGPPATPVKTLLKAYDIGKAAGLRFVYPGNIHGGVEDRENTYCPACGALIIRRTGFIVEENRMSVAGKCPACDAAIAGVWEDAAPRCSNGSGIPRPVRI